MKRAGSASAILGVLSCGRYFELIPVDAVLFELPTGSVAGEHTDDLEQLYYEFEEDNQ